MFFNLKATAFMLCSCVLLNSSYAFATTDINMSRDRDHHRFNNKKGVIPAQANFQDENSFAPVADAPIPFTVENFRTNVDVNADKTIFEVLVPGLYSIDAFLLLNLPTIGDTATGFITINGRELLTFFESETRTGVSPIVGFHFEDRLVYLNAGDKVSVVLSSFPPGTTVLSRGFVMVALNNSRESCSR